MTQQPFLAYEIRGEPIGIPGVVVRIAVGVHIAEVVSVVVIRRTLPPVSGGEHGRRNPNRQVLQKHTHKSQNSYLPLSLLSTLVSMAFSASISSSSSCDICSSFFFASDELTLSPFDFDCILCGVSCDYVTPPFQCSFASWIPLNKDIERVGLPLEIVRL